MAKISKLNDGDGCSGCEGRVRGGYSLLVRVQTAAATVEFSVKVPQKLEIGLLCDSDMLFLDIFSMTLYLTGKKKKDLAHSCAVMFYSQYQGNENDLDIN